MTKDKYIALEDKYKSFKTDPGPPCSVDWEDISSLASIRSLADMIPTTDAKSIKSEVIIKTMPNAKSVVFLSFGFTYPFFKLFEA